MKTKPYKVLSNDSVYYELVSNNFKTILFCHCKLPASCCWGIFSFPSTDHIAPPVHTFIICLL